MAFAPCHAKDPTYGQAVLRAHDAGVKLIAMLCELDPEAGTISFVKEVPVRLQHGLTSNSSLTEK
jgi:DNA-binding sugar fermentation-stimulating protein